MGGQDLVFKLVLLTEDNVYYDVRHCIEGVSKGTYSGD